MLFSCSKKQSEILEIVPEQKITDNTIIAYTNTPGTFRFEAKLNNKNVDKKVTWGYENNPGHYNFAHGDDSLNEKCTFSWSNIASPTKYEDIKINCYLDEKPDIKASYTFTFDVKDLGHMEISGENELSWNIQSIQSETYTCNETDAIWSYTSNPTLPSGVTFNISTHKLIADGTTSEIGTYYVTIQTTLHGFATASLLVELTINQGTLQIIGPSTIQWNATTASSKQYSCDPSDVTWSCDDSSLPPNISFDDTTAILSYDGSGIPQTYYYLTITATKAGYNPVTLNITVEICEFEDMNISGDETLIWNTLTEKESNVYMCTESIGVTWSCSSVPGLPSGISFNTSTHKLEADGSTIDSGDWNVTIKAEKSGYIDATFSVSLKINPKSMTINSGSSELNWHTVTAESEQYVCSETEGVTWSYAEPGALPGEITLDTSTGELSSTATIIASVSYSIIIKAEKEGYVQATKSVTINISLNTITISCTTGDTDKSAMIVTLLVACA